ncbi:glycerate kinase [Amantichitinum ursilacus]|uniref:Glycerate 2-kinase n=1 Tax=Amantichitinum ursilacus TaxID=857265 RepID=A0A0N0XL32_9NEIS|nr:glycerate kinase [Amantichitinum ursilacus]KPC55307.1 Glycerate 2-kinase [Amantichitinum ursilacus]
MKLVIAPDSFKESLGAAEVARAIARGWQQAWPETECILLPVADGGEGTVDALVAATQGQLISQSVTGPLGECVKASWGLSGDGQTAFIEMASAAGLMLVPPSLRDPGITTTYGVGELIRAALDHGARHIVLGLGGSATNDGGAGMLQALGLRWLDAAGKSLPFGGLALARLASIDVSGLDARLAQCRFEVACDVDNPLIGAQGASVIFGPQKGATPAQVAQLDAALTQYARVIEQHLGRSIAHTPGAGAAGGMGAAALAFLQATLRPGIALVLDTVGLAAHLADADLVITGEGKLDGQTLRGKAPLGVAALARHHGVPVLALAGSVAADAAALQQHGITALFSIQPGPGSLQDALADASARLETTARNLATVYRLGLHHAPRDHSSES